MGWAARAKVSAGNPVKAPRTIRHIDAKGVDAQLEVVGMARIKFADRQYAMNPSGQLRRLRPGGSLTAEEKAALPKEVWNALSKSLAQAKENPGGSSEAPPDGASE